MAISAPPSIHSIQTILLLLIDCVWQTLPQFQRPQTGSGRSFTTTIILPSFRLAAASFFTGACDFGDRRPASGPSQIRSPLLPESPTANFLLSGTTTSSDPSPLRSPKVMVPAGLNQSANHMILASENLTATTRPRFVMKTNWSDDLSPLRSTWPRIGRVLA